MIQAFNSGASGLRAQQMRMDVIANNVANVDTTAYKAVRMDFQDALYQAMLRPVQPQDQLNLQLGHGVSVGATTRMPVKGVMQVTGRALDFYLDDGGAFFAVQDSAGNTFYTRDGSFQFSSEPDDNYLVTGDGNYVLNPNGERIFISEKDAEVVVNPDGVILMRDGAEYGTIGTHTFANPEGLTAVGRNLFAVSDNSGPAVAAQAPSVKQGVLEASNVDMGEEMTRLIRAQRAYQFSARVVSTADEMEGLANNMRR